jgi:hypothetical protein
MIYLRRGPKAVGPIDFDTFKSQVKQKKLKKSDEVANDPDGPWHMLGDVFNYMLSNSGTLPETEPADVFDALPEILVNSNPLGASTPANPNLRPCPDCGRTVSKRAQQCPDCGAPLGVTSTECRLTVGRAHHSNGAMYLMDIKIDGEDAFELKQGQKGTCKLEPGEHTLFAKLGLGFLGVKAETRFTIEEGQHVQIEANPGGGALRNKMEFNNVVFEGNYDYRT